MKKKIKYNRNLKVWELHSSTPNQKPQVEYVKKKSQADQWLKGEIGNGNCYEIAAKLTLDSNKYPNLLLCHGTVTGQGPISGARFGHGWNEYDAYLPQTQDSKQLVSISMVIDQSNGRTVEMPSVIYYRIGQINQNEVKRFSSKEVRKNILMHGHWGPWDL
jgi:hypothetical protein